MSDSTTGGEVYCWQCDGCYSKNQGSPSKIVVLRLASSASTWTQQPLQLQYCSGCAPGVVVQAQGGSQ